MTNAHFVTVLQEVGRGLTALGRYRDDIILIGGIAPVLYRAVPAFRRPDHPALATTEADLSLPPRLPILDDESVITLLLKAGFVVYEAPGIGHGKPGKQFFQDARHGTEFLTPLRGPATDALVELQPGLRAPALRYLDLLAHEPLVIDLRTVPLLDVAERGDVRVPHPTMYVLQKVLARKSGRGLQKQPKDMAYAYDVALLTQPIWSDLAEVVERAAAHHEEWRAWIERALRELDRLFASETSDGTVEAALVYRSAMPSGAPTERAITTIMTRFAAALRGSIRR